MAPRLIPNTLRHTPVCTVPMPHVRCPPGSSLHPVLCPYTHHAHAPHWTATHDPPRPAHMPWASSTCPKALLMSPVHAMLVPHTGRSLTDPITPTTCSHILGLIYMPPGPTHVPAHAVPLIIPMSTCTTTIRPFTSPRTPSANVSAVQTVLERRVKWPKGSRTSRPLPCLHGSTVQHCFAWLVQKCHGQLSLEHSQGDG